MQILIQIGASAKPEVYEISKEKAKFLIEMAGYLADDTVDENSAGYKKFFEGEIKKAMQTKRVKSGNSLRSII